MNDRLLDPAVIAAVGRLDLVARTVVEGFLLGLHKSPYHGLSQEFAEHRPYIQGDEVRHVDWRLFARSDRLYVKKFEEETNAPVRLLLDSSASLSFAPRELSKFDYARVLIASLAYIAVRQNDRVGLTCFSDQVDQRLPSRGTKRHLQAIIAALEKVQPAGTADIAETLLREASSWKRKGIAILVSDLYDDPLSVIGAARKVRRAGHELLVFHLLDRYEKRLEGNGAYELRDLETGQSLMVDIPVMRRQYVEAVQARLNLLQTEFANAGVTYVEFDTSEPLDKALALFLKSRAFGGKR
jgi:uncharacterized protein (DUF58 family)